TTGELYTLPILPNARPGVLTKLWESGPTEGPDGFALARSGNVYMALVGPNTNQLVVISPTGTELARFPTDKSGNNGSSVPFDHAGRKVAKLLLGKGGRVLARAYVQVAPGQDPD